jgi:hypothetical protein
VLAYGASCFSIAKYCIILFSKLPFVAVEFPISASEFFSFHSLFGVSAAEISFNSFLEEKKISLCTADARVDELLVCLGAAVSLPRFLNVTEHYQPTIRITGPILALVFTSHP